MTSRVETVDSPSEVVQDALDEGHELDYHQLE
jgi:succinate dehydrogenase / fumarate reductase flavoprotein subunit